MTGKRITGRQDFVDVFEPNGAFAIFKWKSRHRIVSSIANGEAEGYPSSANAYVTIRSTFDLLRAKIFLTTQAGIHTPLDVSMNGHSIKEKEHATQSG